MPELCYLLYSDEDGGTPAAHITQILGTSGMELSEALASGVTAYSNEPNTGTMHQAISNVSHT